jgi:glycosyltransferase involved in cell wall biosynthesis
VIGRTHDRLGHFLYGKGATISLVANGKVLLAAVEERFTHHKLQDSFPMEALQEVRPSSYVRGIRIMTGDSSKRYGSGENCRTVLEKNSEIANPDVMGECGFRIAFFCSHFRPLIGGAERQAEKLAAALAARGCHVRIFTPRVDPDSPEHEEVQGVFIERFRLNELARRHSVPGIALVNIPNLLWQVIAALRLRLKEVDVLHCHIASLQTVGAALAARMAGIPVLCKAATADHRSDLGEIEKTGASGWLVSWLARLVIGQWVATTQAVADELVRAGASSARIVKIPNGVESSREPKRRQREKQVRRFLYLGRISANAGRDLPTLIRAFDRLASVYASLELAIVGDGDLIGETQQLAEMCASRTRIHIPGFGQAGKWLDWADCFGLPSRWEGLSNALLEAMAAGLPCIANGIPPNREVLDGGAAGVLVPVGDENRLYEAMRQMVVDPGYAEEMGKAALQRVRSEYNIAAVAEKYINLYQALIKGKTP